MKRLGGQLGGGLKVRGALLAGALWLLGSVAWADDTVMPFDDNEPFTPSFDDWGEAGLLQIPNARMFDDGEFGFTVSHATPYYRYSMEITPMPWLEVNFRYTQIQNRLYGAVSFSGSQEYKDRAFDAKIRFLEEGPYNPALALKIRDVAGTGLFSGEYLVASRRIYDVDLTGGLAWGNAGSRGTIANPFGMISSFKTDRTSTGTGNFSFDYFHGKRASFFGGVEYHGPLKGMRLKLEYDGNSYQDEPLSNKLNDSLPINAGVDYAVFPWMTVGLGYERGSTLMLRASMHANFNKDYGVPQTDTPPLPAVPKKTNTAASEPVSTPVNSTKVETPDPVFTKNTSRPVFDDAQAFTPKGESEAVSQEEITSADDHQSMGAPVELTEMEPAVDQKSEVQPIPSPSLPPPLDGHDDGSESSQATVASNEKSERTQNISAEERDKISQAIFADLDKERMKGLSLSLDAPIATLRFSQNKYRNPAQAVGRAARIVAHHLPPDFKAINIDTVEKGLPVLETSLYRSDVERMAEGEITPAEIWQHVKFTPPPDSDPEMTTLNDSLYPQFDWDLSPHLRQQIGGPNNFYFYQIYAQLAGQVEFSPGFHANAAIGENLFNNFKKLTLESDSELPHVRSDIKDYIKGHNTWMENLYTSYVEKLDDDIYGRISGGYFELMYGGISGELLYRPHNSLWAVGTEWNAVQQRDYNGLFGFRNYHTVTGGLQFYRYFPQQKLTASVLIGRYLARDVGATFSIQREFENGIRVGAFFTKTNVSAEKFGEGSFDKGFNITIPFDLFTGEPTRSTGSVGYRPLTRDGGQMVGTPDRLYDMTQGANDASMNQGWNKFDH